MGKKSDSDSTVNGKLEEENLKNEQDLNKINDGSKACFDVIKNEYDHVFDRADKLDTKINIVLTFCGVMLIFLFDLFKLILALDYPEEMARLALVIIYLLGIIFMIGLYIYCLISLISLIKPTQFKRLDSESLLLRNLHLDSKETVYTYVAVKYTGAIKENNNILEEKFNRYRNVVILLIVVLIIAFILYFLEMII